MAHGSIHSLGIGTLEALGGLLGLTFCGSAPFAQLGLPWGDPRPSHGPQGPGIPPRSWPGLGAAHPAAPPSCALCAASMWLWRRRSTSRVGGEHQAGLGRGDQLPPPPLAQPACCIQAPALSSHRRALLQPRLRRQRLPHHSELQGLEMRACCFWTSPSCSLLGHATPTTPTSLHCSRALPIRLAHWWPPAVHSCCLTLMHVNVSFVQCVVEHLERSLKAAKGSSFGSKAWASVQVGAQEGWLLGCTMIACCLHGRQCWAVGSWGSACQPQATAAIASPPKHARLLLPSAIAGEAAPAATCHAGVQPRAEGAAALPQLQG